MYKSKREYIEESYNNDNQQEGRQLQETMEELFLATEQLIQEEDR